MLITPTACWRVFAAGRQDRLPALAAHLLRAGLETVPAEGHDLDPKLAHLVGPGDGLLELLVPWFDGLDFLKPLLETPQPAGVEWALALRPEPTYLFLPSADRPTGETEEAVGLWLGTFLIEHGPAARGRRRGARRGPPGARPPMPAHA